MIVAIAFISCSESSDGPFEPGGEDNSEFGESTSAGAGEDGTLDERWQALLDARQVDPSAALRTASLRLRGDLPTLAEIKRVADADDPLAEYTTLVEEFLETPQFVAQTMAFWRDTMKMGASAEATNELGLTLSAEGYQAVVDGMTPAEPSLDSAPAFATQLVIEDRPVVELFTATSGTCPDYRADTAQIVRGDCNNGVATHAGVLSNPAVQRHFYSNLAFRRVRWVQETFVCQEFPAEYGDSVDVGAPTPYTAPWPFESIAGSKNAGRVDFHDTASTVCANCHATMNHLAPLFGRFDENGAQQAEFVVTLPLDGLPAAQRTDWLPDGESTAWRVNVPAEDLPALGAAMAADPEVARCFVTRVWNWAMGRGDVVTSLATVPEKISQEVTKSFVDSGHRFKPLVREMFLSEDFTRF